MCREPSRGCGEDMRRTREDVNGFTARTCRAMKPDQFVSLTAGELANCCVGIYSHQRPPP